MCTLYLVVRGQKSDLLRGPPASLPAGLLTAPCPRAHPPIQSLHQCQRTALTVSPRLPVTSLPGSLAPQAEDCTPHQSSRLPCVPLWPATGSCSQLPASRAGPALLVFSASPRTLRTSAAGPVLGTVPPLGLVLQLLGAVLSPQAGRLASVPCVPPQKLPSDPVPGSPEWRHGPHWPSRGAVHLSPLVCERGHH